MITKSTLGYGISYYIKLSQSYLIHYVTDYMTLWYYNNPDAIYYTSIIFNFMILTLYISYNNKMLHYIEHALYRLEKLKTVFKNY